MKHFALIKILFFVFFFSYIPFLDAQENELSENYELYFKYYDEGKFELAAKSINRCAEIFEKGNYNLEDTNYAYVKTFQGGMFQKAGQIDNAIEAELISQRIFTKFYGKYCMANKFSCQNLARYYSESNLLEVSNKYYLDLIDVIEINFDNKNKDIPFIYYLIYVQYSLLNKFELAIDYALKAIKANEVIYGGNTTEISKINEDISGYYSMLGNYGKSIEFSLIDLNMYGDLVGRSDSAYVHKLNNLSLSYFQIDSISKARTFAEKSFSICKSVFGENSPRLADTYNILGRILSREGDFEKANENYYQALKIQKMNVGYSNKLTATLYNNIGLNMLELGQYNNALQLFMQAESEDSIPNSTFIGNKGLAQNSLGLYKDASQNFERALILLEQENGWQDRIAITYNNLSVSYQNLALYDKALLCAQKALNIDEELFGEVHINTITVRNNIAFIYYLKGLYNRALEEYLLIVQSVFKNKEFYKKELPLLFNNIALCYENIGDYIKAMDYYEESFTLTKELFGENHPSLATNLNNIGCSYLKIGEYNKALRYLNQAKDIDLNINNKNGLSYSTTLNNIGSVYRTTGDINMALTISMETLAIRERILGTIHTDVAISLTNVATDYGSLKRYDEAIECYRNALDIFDKVMPEIHNNKCNILRSIGLCYLYLGEFEKGINYLEESLLMAEKVYQINQVELIDSYLDMAIIKSHEGDFKASNNLMNKCLIGIKKDLDINFEVFTENQKLILLNKNQKYFNYFDNLTLNKFKIDSTIIKSFNNTQLISNASLRSSSRMRDATNKSNDPKLISSYSKWTSLKEQLIREHSYSNEEIQKLGINITATEDSISFHEKELAKYSMEFRNELQIKNLTHIDVNSKLVSNDVFIQFHSFKYHDGLKWTDSTLYTAYIIRKDQKHPEMVYLFEQAALDTLLPAPDTRSMMNNLYQTGDSALYNLVWKPLEPYLKGVKTAYVAPSGLLHKIAFAAAPLHDGSRLSDRYQLRQVLSGHDVVFKEDPAVFNNSSTTSVALLGGINYEYVPEAKDSVYFSPLSLLPESTDRGTAFGYLPGTESEVSSIEQLLKNDKVNVTLLKGNNATEEQFKTLQGDKAPKVLHIATHGFFAPDPKRDLNKENSMRLMGQENRYTAADNPLYRSGLLLAGGNSSWTKKITLPADQDGVLTAYEVANMDLSNTQLVVLSACETALGDVKGREGVFGLQRGFRLAGAKYMLISLWRIPDKETAEYMTKFYSELAKTNNIVTAYQTTQTHMKTTYPNEPQIWAGMALVE
jgi:tetratricopeptide (TPR) repeat protein